MLRFREVQVPVQALALLRLEDKGLVHNHLRVQPRPLRQQSRQGPVVHVRPLHHGRHADERHGRRLVQAAAVLGICSGHDASRRLGSWQVGGEEGERSRRARSASFGEPLW